MSCFQRKRNYDRLGSLRADAFRGHGFSLLAPARGMPALSAKDGFSRPSLALPSLRGFQIRGTVLSFAPSKTICCSRRTRKTSAALHRTKKMVLNFRGGTALRSPRRVKLFDASMIFFCTLIVHCSQRRTYTEAPRGAMVFGGASIHVQSQRLR